jgi:hypothetical protein
MSFIGWGLVWAGGMSNLMDRTLRQGHVTDFIFISAGPLHTGIFNVADLTIVIGIAAIALDLWNRRDLRLRCSGQRDRKARAQRRFQRAVSLFGIRIGFLTMRCRCSMRRLLDCFNLSR